MKKNQNDRLEYYTGEILTKLADSYRGSKKDSGTNVIHRRTPVKPEQLYRRYRRNDGDPVEIEAVNEAAGICRQLGFVNFRMKSFSNEIDGAIYLEDARIGEVECYLKEHYGYETKADRIAAIREIVRRYEGRSPAADSVCRELCAKLDQNRIPARCEQTEEILRALVFVENNRTPLYLREASQMIYGSTKYFEEKTEEAVCRKLRDYLKRPCAEDEMPGEILREYHIYPEQQRLCIKGDVTLVKGGTEIRLGAFPGGIEFAADELPDIQEIHTAVRQLVTVENRTAYFRCKDRDSVFFYLGGYVNRTQRDFLKKTGRDNPHLTFLHFGDIDAGGFHIHRHLCRMTGLDFGLWHMSVRELADPRYADCLLELTAQDRRRLKTLAGEELYGEAAQYMLRQNVKLEQEIVSYYVFGS